MQLFGDPRSTNTRKVMMTMAELETPYELVHVDFALGEHKQPEHLQRQPFGQMPALHDDGFTLYETHAICRYVNDRSGGTLMPSDPRGRAVASQWMSIESANFAAHAMTLVYHHLLKIEQQQSALDHAGAALDTTFGVLAEQLSQHPFVAGPGFSLADICFMPYFEYLMLTPAHALISKSSALPKWWDTVRNRPTWQAVIAQP